MNKYTRHQDALTFLRKRMYDRTLTYREVGELLSAFCMRKVSKAEAWNAEHRNKRCAADIRQTLVDLDLLVVDRRWRFFFEVDEEKYQRIREFLGDRTFTEYMNEKEQPWD